MYFALTRKSSWLTVLADPDGAAGALPERPMRVGELSWLIELADRHGVLPAVASNLARAAEKSGPQRLVRPGRASTGSAGEVLRKVLAGANEQLLKHTAFSLMLRTQADEIVDALARRRIPAIILKGSDFADRLYRRPGLRLFTDVDVLVSRQQLPDAEQTMEELAYVPAPVAMKHDADYGQSRFRRPDGRGGKVEIHWNLVNSPTLRRGLSVELQDLQFEESRPQAAGRLRPSSSSLLLIAAVHAAASHCFDRLQLLCDVRQAARAAAGSLDEDWLADAARRTGSGLALTAALYLSEKIMPEPSCRKLLRELRLPRCGYFWKLLLTKGVVMRCGAHIDSFRRQIFRQMLKKR